MDNKKNVSLYQNLLKNNFDFSFHTVLFHSKNLLSQWNLVSYLTSDFENETSRQSRKIGITASLDVWLQGEL